MNFQENFSLKKYNTFGIEAMAKYFATFKNVAELGECVEFVKSSALSSKPAVLILGGGSNILFTKNYDGVVLKNEIAGIQQVDEDEDFVYIKAGAGESWHQLVLYCVKQNLGGVENLSLIPGSVGASPMQNIGAYGVETKDVFHSLEAYHLQEQKIVNFGIADCEFGYRESVFKGKYKNEFVITNVTFRLNKNPLVNTSYGAITQELDRMGVSTPTIQNVSQAIINIRQGKLPDPARIGNAGSFFKNPEIANAAFLKLQEKFPAIIGYDLRNGKTKLAAGWLIEKCGWKGYREGDAGCNDKQSLVLVNFGKATGDEIFALSDKIIRSVKERFGVELVREVNVV